MKSRVREKNITETTDNLQDQLERILMDTTQKFLTKSDVKKLGLTHTQGQDVIAGALLTLFTKNLAYHSAQQENFDHTSYLQQVFDSMSQLFARSRENFVEVLKDKDKKNSSSH